MKFGEKISRLRRDKGYTQKQLGELIGVTQRTIAGYETENNYPKRRETYEKLAEVLEVNENYLHTEDETFLASAAEKYGYRGKKQAELLLDDVGALFAGGILSDNDKDSFFRVMTEIYFDSKEHAKKYTPKKYRKDN